MQSVDNRIMNRAEDTEKQQAIGNEEEEILVSAFEMKNKNISYTEQSIDASKREESKAANAEELKKLSNYLSSLERISSAEADMLKSSVYWNQRKDAELYDVIIKILQNEAPRADTVLDVGAYESPLLTRISWVQTKVATDIQARPNVWKHAKGVAFVTGDFLQLEFGTRFDIVICTQVVEHLGDDIVRDFVTKLARVTEQTLIISTTHELEAGEIDGHVQDPISQAKFQSWFSAVTSRGQGQRGEGTLRIEFVGQYWKDIWRPQLNIIGIWTRTV